MDSLNFALEAPHWSAPILSGDAIILWQFADPFGGVSIRKGTSNRDITVFIGMACLPVDQ